MQIRRAPIVGTLLMVGVLACNLQFGATSEEAGLAATATAQAIALEDLGGAPTASPPGLGSTATPSGARVTVSANTNCREGPTTDFDVVLTMTDGESAEVVGKFSPSNYWIISDSAGGTCWLWGQYAEVTGDISSLPEYPAPPTPQPQSTKTPRPSKTPTATPSPPNAPTGFTATRTCEGALVGNQQFWLQTITFTWQDNSDTEDAYQIYQGNNLNLAVLDANTTSFVFQQYLNMGTGGPLFDTFSVYASGEGGLSPKAYVDAPRCP